MAQYELWLTDDAGRRIRSVHEGAFFSYTRTVNGLGTFNFGIPFAIFNDLKPYFQPDWRIEVWRSPQPGSPLRREDAFMLRQHRVYTREDNVQMIQFYGRNGMDLLKRRAVIQRGGTQWAQKTDYVDDMMKAFVREQMLYGSALDEDGAADNGRAWPQSEFSVQGDVSLGPSVTRNYPGRIVFDICRDLAATSAQLYASAPTTYRRICFDVLPVDIRGVMTTSHSHIGWEFVTFADRRGGDRRTELEFSVANGNLKGPDYSENHMDEVSVVWVGGNGQGVSQMIASVEDSLRVGSSRWNRIERWKSASSESTAAALADAGRPDLQKGEPDIKMLATLLNAPGGPDTPRSLYGVDWDFGDWVRVNYAGVQFDMEISLVYVSVNENGREEITGRNEVQ